MSRRSDATRRRPPQRTRAAGAVVAAVVVLLAAPAAPAAPAPAGAGAPDGVPGAVASTVAVHRQALDLVLVEQSPWVPSEGLFTARFDAGPIPADATVTVSVRAPLDTDPIDGRVAFRAGLSGDPAAFGAEVQHFTAPAPIMLDPATGQLVLQLPVRSEAGGDPNRHFLPNPGVHPVLVSVTAVDGTVVAQEVCHLVHLPAASESAQLRPLKVATTVPVQIAMPLNEDGSPNVTAVDRLALGATIDVLSNTTATADLVVGPAGAEALVRSPDADDGALLAGLRAAVSTRTVMRQPFARLDLGSWAAAPRSPELVYQVIEGVTAAAAALGTEPAAGVWPHDPTLTTGAAALLQGGGVSTLLVAPDELSPPGDDEDDEDDEDHGEDDGGGDDGEDDTDASPDLDTDVAGPQPDLDATLPIAIDTGESSMPALIADPGLAAWLSRRGDGRESAIRLLTELAVLAFDDTTDDDGVVIDSPGITDPTRDAHAALFAGLVGNPLLAAAPISELPNADEDDDDPPAPRTLARTPPDPLSEYVAQAEALRPRLATHVSMSGDFTDLDETMSHTLFFAADRELGVGRWEDYVDAVGAVLDAELSGVTAPAGQTVTLTSRSASLPLRIHNDLDHRVQVLIRLDNDRLAMDGGPTRVVVLEPGDNRVPLDVTTRTSGQFPVDVDLLTPDGQLVLGSIRYEIRSTAVSGVGVVLSVAALAFLLVWWIRNSRRTRRNRKLVERAGHPSAGTVGPE